MTDVVAVTMPMRNGAATLKRAVNSVAMQFGTKREKKLIILDDESDDRWEAEIRGYLSESWITVLRKRCGSVAVARNELLSFVRDTYGSNTIIARLDCDDELSSPTVLRDIENRMDSQDVDVLLCGNRLRQDGKLIERVNIAGHDLLNLRYLQDRVSRMAQGDENAELPSCNIVHKPLSVIRYPIVSSAEDHMLVVKLLMMQDRVKIMCAPDILYCIYSLSGNVSKMNRAGSGYYKARREILNQMVNNAQQ